MEGYGRTQGLRGVRTQEGVELEGMGVSGEEGQQGIVFVSREGLAHLVH